MGQKGNEMIVVRSDLEMKCLFFDTGTAVRHHLCLMHLEVCRGCPQQDEHQALLRMLNDCFCEVLNDMRLRLANLMTR